MIFIISMCIKLSSSTCTSLSSPTCAHDFHYQHVHHNYHHQHVHHYRRQHAHMIFIINMCIKLSSSTYASRYQHAHQIIITCVSNNHHQPVHQIIIINMHILIIIISMRILIPCRGPNSLSLSDSGQAVAVATGDVEVGDYEFKLTVRDQEEQTSSDKLKVHVKMSE